eukprot:TRINITY_DN75951_c0_g1_i1.p1 TRINITY_DN75951_c0_g1~~TRINITY_DN75951_c0_g1_i1.p1  ORF type:complete len:266 (-),score=50.70 TRINITY_DN75951_c0_g1_i1:913-1710(-)
MYQYQPFEKWLREEGDSEDEDEDENRRPRQQATTDNPDEPQPPPGVSQPAFKKEAMRVRKQAALDLVQSDWHRRRRRHEDAARRRCNERQISGMLCAKKLMQNSDGLAKAQGEALFKQTTAAAVEELDILHDGECRLSSPTTNLRLTSFGTAVVLRDNVGHMKEHARNAFNDTQSDVAQRLMKLQGVTLGTVGSIVAECRQHRTNKPNTAHGSRHPFRALKPDVRPCTVGVPPQLPGAKLSSWTKRPMSSPRPGAKLEQGASVPS